jgi:hypothetical protein
MFRGSILLLVIVARAGAQCTTSATLPAPATGALACYAGTTGGGSTAANAPTLSPSATGVAYCAAYSFQCSTSDQSAACVGQPAGTVARAWVPLSADTAQQMLTMPTVYMQPYMCNTNGCNTVAASATCTSGGAITTLTSCGGSTCNVPASANNGCAPVNTAPIPLDGSCSAVGTSFFYKAVAGTAANTATLTWFSSAGCNGSPMYTNTNLPLGGSPTTGCQSAPFGSIYAAGSSTGFGLKSGSAAASSVALLALAAAAAAALSLMI